MRSKFTDIFIKRPVLSIVISILIFLVGLRSAQLLTLREFPEVTQSVITINTVYPGANSSLVKGFITNPIERAIAGAGGIEYLSAQSVDGMSTVSAHINMGVNPDTAFTSIMSKVSSVRSQLPKEAQEPVITKGNGHSIDVLYMSFSSDGMSAEQVTEYVRRAVQPSLETVEGVAKAEILGGKTFAMRIWLNPQRMQAYGITSDDITQALQKNNFQSAAGNTKGEYVAYSVKAETGIQTPAAFQQLVIKSVKGTLVRLSDVAKVQLGSEDYDSAVIFDGKKSVFIGIETTPEANPLVVIKQVKQALTQLIPRFPPALKAQVVYDSTVYIQAALHEVTRSIIESTLIVLAVIFLFLGSLRAVIIPLVTIPLSLVGVMAVMLVFGFSINILTLLAMVLAIGMVVDDAIVVVENCYRHIEEGMSPVPAALKGAQEIAYPVIIMSLTLAAVYLPIGFMQGLTGQLFGEFALTLAGSVIISGIIALTLSPMMCARFLQPTKQVSKFNQWIDHRLHRFSEWYKRKLTGALETRSVILVMALTLFIACGVLYMGARQELAPSEDQNVAFMSATGPEYANINYLLKYTSQMQKVYRSFPEMSHFMILNGLGGPNNAIAAMMLKPWDQRKRSQSTITKELQEKVKQIPGISTVVFPLSALPSGGDGLPVQFVLTSTQDYSDLFTIGQDLLNKFKNSGMFVYVDSSLKYNKPQIQVHIDRNKAGAMGISMQEIGSALATALGGNYVNRFDMSGQSYKVIPQLLSSFRFDPAQLNSISLSTMDGKMIPLSAVVNFKQSVQPNKLEEFQQLNSVTLQGVPMPGKSMGDVVNYLQQKIMPQLPSDMGVNFAGASRDYVQQGDALLWSFLFAVVIIYLLLAAQFESFRDPIIVLVSVPMSIFGAMFFIYMGVATVNIYTQIGLLTLVGLISKHGILIVDFANKLQQQGLNKYEAIIEAASVRLRPILMTTVSMVAGVIPLILASGAQAHCRFDIGLVIATGMGIGTIFTLFVVPTMYTYLARDSNKDSNIGSNKELTKPSNNQIEKGSDGE